MTTAADHDEAPGLAPRIAVRPLGRGRAEVRVLLAEQTIACDQATAGSAISRSRCVKALTAQAPTLIDEAIAAEIERALLNMPPDAAPEAHDAGQGRAVEYEAVEPWPDAVDGADLLDAIEATVRRYVVLPDHAPAAVALWVVHAWCYERFVHSPRLLLSSPTMRCGKTQLLRVLGLLTPRPQAMDNATPAVLFRLIEAYRPTLLLDETDRWMRDPDSSGALIGIVNSGHRRGGTVPRCVGDAHEVRRFGVYAPMALAGIGSLAGTIRDRAIELPMARKAPGERVDRMRDDRLAEELAHLRRRAARWVADHGDDLGEADPELPASLSDRGRDNWRPLAAIADAAGGSWPARARAAAVALAAVEADDGLAALLLGDLREVLDGRGLERIPTVALIEALVGMAERPWPTLERGKPITPRAISRMLGGFAIRPRSIKLADGSTPKGYRREDCADAFSRYLPPAESATPPPTAPQADPGRFGSATADATVADPETRGSAPHAGGGGVADVQGGCTADGGMPASPEAGGWCL